MSATRKRISAQIIDDLRIELVVAIQAPSSPENDLDMAWIRDIMELFNNKEEI